MTFLVRPAGLMAYSPPSTDPRLTNREPAVGERYDGYFYMYIWMIEDHNDGTGVINIFWEGFLIKTVRNASINTDYIDFQGYRFYRGTFRQTVTSGYVYRYHGIYRYELAPEEQELPGREPSTGMYYSSEYIWFYNVTRKQITIKWDGLFLVTAAPAATNPLTYDHEGLRYGRGPMSINWYVMQNQQIEEYEIYRAPIG